MADAYLVHHGILGQKWGVRRYQNKDGTLTTAGKRRKRTQYIEPSLNPNDPIHKAAHDIQKDYAEGARVGNTTHYAKQLAIAAVTVATGAVAVKALLKEGKTIETKGFFGRTKVKTVKAGAIRSIMDTSIKDVAQKGPDAAAKYAADVALAAVGTISAGALMAKGIARGAGATAAYAHYITSSNPNEAAKENFETARRMEEQADNSIKRRKIRI